MLTGAVALKEDDLQFVCDPIGDIPPDNTSNLGLYYQDTRFLSVYDLKLEGSKPIFLSSSTNKHYIATFQYVNPPLVLGSGQRVRQQTVSIRRSRFVNAHGAFERIGFLNCNQFEIEVEVVIAVDADFRDIFAVRGFKTQRVAGRISIEFGGDSILFDYRGRDGFKRSTEVMFSRPAEAISTHEVRFCMRLAPQQHESLVVRIQPRVGRGVRRLGIDFDAELEKLAASYRRWDDASTKIETNNEQFDREILRAGRYDIRGLLEQTRFGIVPDAGVPWYAVPFGRDAIITALQTLVYNPDIAEGTLRFLAANQGTTVDEFKEEEPGKIMHEVRRGELARLREVPHTPYFGTVDATPLFLVLFVETMEWSGSERLYLDLLPAAMRALEWIDAYGDIDGDGYVEYITHRPGGVQNQGWKDSANSVQYDNGQNAKPPIALVEVQGYVYQAKVGMARLLRSHAQLEVAERLEGEAEALRVRFNRDFWMEDEQFYAQALDRDKHQVCSVTSNAGHCLWSGICDPDKAEAMARRLLARDMFSGWGVRTLSSHSPNYNPMSYHNGSVWPHDTALIAMGLRRSGYAAEATVLITSLIEAAARFDDSRLPELFCGFQRDHRFNSSPTAYIVSCSPQAWAAGCIFMLLQAILDLRPDLERGMLHAAPLLPELFRRITVKNLRVGAGRLGLQVSKSGEETLVEVIERGRIRLQVATS
jgi:glycogen debranching enzyme